MFFLRPSGLQFVDRGDYNLFDFNLEDFTTDGNWHDLDLSSIIPINTKLIRLSLYLKSDSDSSAMRIRKKGYTSEYNWFKSYPRAANTGGIQEGDIICNSNRLVEYKIDVATWISIEFYIRGWFM